MLRRIYFRGPSALIPLLITISLFPLVLQAGLFEQLAVSGTAMSLGNAVTAYPPGVMAIHYNPAGLTDIEGSEFDNGLSYVQLTRTVKFTQGRDAQGNYWAPFGGYFNPDNRPPGQPKDPLAGTKGTLESGYMVIPFVNVPLSVLLGPAMGYATHEKGSRLTFAFGQYSPYGVGMENKSDSPLSYLGQKAFFLRMNYAAPSAAYKLTDTLSVGVSVGLGVNVFSFATNMRTPNDMVAMTGTLGKETKGLEIPLLSELTLPPPWFGGGLSPYEKAGSLSVLGEDYFSPSYNLGVLWKPVNWFSWGAVYQSASKASMSGNYDFEYGQSFQNMIHWLGSSPLLVISSSMLGLPNSSVPFQKGRFSLDMTWPERFQTGVMLRPVEGVRFLCDYNWTNWKQWPRMVLSFDQQIQLLRLARLLGYPYGPNDMVINLGTKNTPYFSYGLELKPLKPVTLRFGYEPRPTSIEDQYFGPVPMSDMKIYSMGIGLDLEDKPKPRPKGDLLKQLQNPNHIDINFSFMHLANVNVPSNSSINLNSTAFSNAVYNPYAGLNFNQKFNNYIFSINQIFKW